MGSNGIDSVGAKLTKESLGAIMGVSPSLVADWVGPINEAMKVFDISTPKRLAAFLANVRHEAGQLLIKDLYEGNYLGAESFTKAIFNKNYDGKNGNIKGTDDGSNFRGRGVIQLTGRNNYAAATKAINDYYGVATYDLVSNFRTVSSDPNIGALTGAFFWQSPKTTATGENLNSVVDRSSFSDVDNFKRTIIGVNGGGAKPKTISERTAMWIGISKYIYDQNSYGNMKEVLSSFGLSANSGKGYSTQFGIVLKPRSLQDIVPSAGKKIIIESAAEDLGCSPGITSDKTSLQSLMTDFEAQPGEVDMLFFAYTVDELPNSPQPVLVGALAAGAAEQISGDLYGTIGVCYPVSNLKGKISILSPVGDALSVFAQNKDPGYVENLGKFMDSYESMARAEVLIQPQNGGLALYGQNLDPVYGGEGVYKYTPNSGFVGSDRVEFLVTYGGKKIKVIYFIKSIGLDVSTYNHEAIYKKYCPTPSEWLIPSNGGGLFSLLQTLGLPGSLDKLKLDVSVLPDSTAAQTFGTGTEAKISLDYNAAGHGWFIDATPTDNEEFLPTADPNVWIAKAGSAAEGKMDMLTVLLHEYGHVLGLEHSADGADAMAATLKPGERRLWSAGDLAALARLGVSYAQNADGSLTLASASAPAGADPAAPGLPLAPLSTSSLLMGLGIYRRRSAMDVGADNMSAANATLMNGKLNDAESWTTRGAVSFAADGATLAERADAQAALRQVFSLGANDRFLRFTVAGDIHRQGEEGPADAFEAALLDANTGAALRNIAGLSHGDAFLNIQGGSTGAARMASGVVVTDNADGSRTYTLDLAGITAGTALALSFDLIGFGEADSAVLVRDVQLLSDLLAHDDAVRTAEDTPVRIDVMGNDEVGVSTGVQPVLVAGPQHGSVTLNADGSFSYTPEANWSGSDSFSYALQSGGDANKQTSEAATVTLTVTPVNDAPVAADATLSLLEDGSLRIDFTGFGSDVEADVLEVVIVASPAHGTLKQNTDGSYTYTPAANFNGEDSIRFALSDGSLLSNEATLRLNVTAVNDAPVLAGRSVSTAEDTAVLLDLLSTASDVEADALNVVIVDGPAHGSLIRNDDGSYRYTPAANFNGADSFSYKVSDGELDSDVVTVAITVTPVNDAPVLAGRSVTVAEDTAVLLDLLSTASDVDGDVLSVVIVDGPAHGSLTRNDDGTYSYTPAANFNGADSFSYQVSDGELTSDVVTVAITVTPVNDAPVVSMPALQLAAEEDTPLGIDLLAATLDVDGDVLVTEILAGPANGTLTLGVDGRYTYTAKPDWYGVDSFTWRVGDGQSWSDAATVTIQVAAVNDAPLASDGSVVLLEDGRLIIDFATYGRDVDGDALAPVIVSGPAHGSLIRNADGSYTYAPSADFNGSDSVRFKLTDGALESNEATLSFVVLPVNDAPVLAGRSVSTAEDTALVLNLLSTASDIDSATLTPVIVTQPAHGTLVKNADGTYSYTSAANYNGADSFSYKVSDGMLESGVVTVAITVTAVNDAPVLTGRSVSTAEDTALVLNLLSTASDIDSSTLTPVIVTQPAHGTLVKNADGSYRYTPTANYNGADSFSYKVSDGTLESGVVTVAITVTAVNDAPVLTGRSVTTAEDTALVLNLLSTASDIDSSTLTPVIVTQPAHGNLVKNADGSYRYTPAANYNGADSFSYKVSDGTLESGVVTVAITVTAVNDAPLLASIPAQTVKEGSTLRVKLVGSDVDGDKLTYFIVSGPSGATIDTTTNELVWANPDGPATVSFTVMVKDPSGASAKQSFTVTVQDVPPTLTVTGSATGKAGTAYTLNLGATSVGNDKVTGWTIDWGDGTVQTLTTAPGSVQHVYAKAGNYSIKATAHDQDGSYAVAPLAVSIASAADVVLKAPAVTMTPGAALGNNGAGLPVCLDSAYPLKAISFVMHYDPTVMKVTGVVAGANLPSDAQIDAVVHEPGFVRITINCRSKNISAGQALELVKLKGTVLATAPKGKSSALDLTLNSVVGLMGESYWDKLAAIDGTLTVGAV